MSQDKRTKAMARVQVTIELPLGIGGHWGGDCDLSQVYRQARDSAEGRIVKLLQGHGTVLSSKVIAVIVEEGAA